MLKHAYAFVLFIIFFPGQYDVFALPESIVFEHYSIAQGMFEPVANSVLQDREGYLWFGTWGGIEKFDGYRFTAYKHEANNTASIDIALVQTIYEDREGNIWAGTYSGLEKFNKKNSNFSHYRPHIPGMETEYSNHVYSICEDKFGTLWIGTADGLNIFDRAKGTFICMRHDSSNEASILANNINSIYEDRSGSLWFATGMGLDKLDRSTGKFLHVWCAQGIKDEWAPKFHVNTIFEDKEGILWLGTRDGMIEFNQNKGTFLQYLNEKGNSISSICEDNSGRLWIGSWVSGLYSFNKNTKEIINYSHNPEDPSSISSNSVTSVYFEKSGTLWITTLEDVNKLDLSKKAFKYYSMDGIKSITKGKDNKIWINTEGGQKILDSQTGKITEALFGSNKIQILYDDGKGNLWFAKEGGGLFKRDSKGKITVFQTKGGRDFEYSVVLIYESPDGTIWIGSDSDGLFYIDPTDQKVIKIKIPADYINCVYEDPYGLLWVCTFNRGLYLYNRKTGKIKSYIYDVNDSTSISGQTTLYACEDTKGNLWIGSNGGLNRYNRSNDSFIHYSNLPINATFTILEDDRGNFWYNCREGIFKFNPENNYIQNYNAASGLPKNGFKDWRGVQSDDGSIYFANSTEIIGFHPDDIQNNNFIPPVVITNFSIFNKPFPVKNKIELSYKENFLSFEFAGLSFVSTVKNQYAYKMEGIDTGWVYSGTRRFASYPNLDPGEYVFRVKGSNNDGIWNEKGTSISIIISPPWWNTWWAYALYACLIIFALYGIRKYELNRIGLKNKIKVNQAVLKEKEETEKLKSRFFANISHEFRTPLTLILGPVDKIISSTSEDIIKDANIIRRNSRRLLQLINQLLDLSKLEDGKLKLEASNGNIVSFVKGVVLSFESLAESKDLTLRVEPEKDLIELYFDKEKMIKILSNLLSNAFKFTPEEGTIIVSIKEISNINETGMIEIKIRDTGIGISPEEIPKLFDRFYQVDNSFTKEHEGTGIGLALTKELVELHHGTVSVESKLSQADKAGGGWTEIKLHFPSGRSHLKDDEIIKIEKTESPVYTAESEVSSSMINKVLLDSNDISVPKNETNEPLIEKMIILIVEDNYDMREYIKESLGNVYKVEEAINGEQGVRKAEKIIPDLIISDMMMPKMDGNELTRILKNNEKTSHIPIILLTARSGQENKIEGLETGADDYLTKPFDVKELQARIGNLIKIRRKLQEKYRKLEYLLRSNVKIGNSLDEQFMVKVMEVVNKNLSNEDFSIEEFGSEVGMSRTQFHRKLKAITGKPASMFLRSVRLARAKKMIEEQQGNISEIAFLVGFSSPSYFTKCFREEFGNAPSNLVN